MRYLIKIDINKGNKRTYSVDAANEKEALERLKLRLSPQQRETFVMTSISIDSKSIGTEGTYGLFGGE